MRSPTKTPVATALVDISRADKYLREIYTALFPGGMRLIRNELRGCSTLLDLGCGPDSPIIYTGWTGSLTVGVDAFRGYIEEASRKGFYHNCILADLRFPPFKEEAIVDACVALSILEHLDKEDGLLLLQGMERWARRRVIVVVPNGSLHQNAYDDNPFQAHRSSWSCEDFRRRGYALYGLRGHRSLRSERGYPRLRPALFWILVSQLSQVWTYTRPEIAFEIAAVKRLT